MYKGFCYGPVYVLFIYSYTKCADTAYAFSVYWGNVWIIAEHPPFIFVIHGSEAEYFNGATPQELANLSVGVLYRSDPEKAAKFLRDLLIPWRSEEND